MGHRYGVTFFIIDAFYKVVGHFLILLTHVFLVPSFIGLSEIERCTNVSYSQETDRNQNSTIPINSTRDESNYFQCLDTNH